MSESEFLIRLNHIQVKAGRRYRNGALPSCNVHGITEKLATGITIARVLRGLIAFGCRAVRPVKAVLVILLLREIEKTGSRSDLLHRPSAGNSIFELVT